MRSSSSGRQAAPESVVPPLPTLAPIPLGNGSVSGNAGLHLADLQPGSLRLSVIM